jgi:hypothetical protein
MRSFLLPVAAAAIALSAVASFATEMATGEVAAFDLEAATITLADGTVYSLPAGFEDPGLAVGDNVTIGWNSVDSKNVVETVVIDE